APCHAAQFRNFQQTAMGRSLQIVNSAAAPVQFLHPKTGRRYHVFNRQSKLWIEEFFLDGGRVVYSDVRSARYAIESGHHAGAFLVGRWGRLYQAPVTFYAQAGRWDMSPGFDTKTYVGFTRRVTADCLFCHAGRMNAQNQAIAEIAIDCERCHGPGKQHPAQSGNAIVNPARLSSELRDQVCEQCHLFGAARVPQPGKSVWDYQPGKPLGDVVAIYDYAASNTNTPAVASHPLEMRQSACRLKSQGRMWCGTCHEVHRPLRSTETAAF